MIISKKKLERIIEEERYKESEKMYAARREDDRWISICKTLKNMEDRITSLEKELHPERFQKDNCCCCKCGNTSEAHDCVKSSNY